MDAMDAQDWDRIFQNQKDLCEQHVAKLALLNYLFEKEVISQEDKRKVEKTCEDKNQMDTLLDILRKKPSRVKAYHHLIEGLRIDTSWLAEKIENTETTADPSLKSRNISQVLSEFYTCKSGESVYLTEVKETLKQKGTDTAAAGYSDDKLIQLIHKAFTGVVEENKKKRIGRRVIPDVLLKNVGLKNAIESLAAEKNDDKLRNVGGVKFKIGYTADEVRKFNKDELIIFLEPLLKEKCHQLSCLEILKDVNMSGKLFMTQNSESFKELMSNDCSLDEIKCLSEIIMLLKQSTEMSRNSRAPLETQNLRRFGRSNSSKTYSIKRKLPVTRNINGPLTHPIRNFHLVEEQGLDDALDFIASEVIPFASACLNERQNGTIYFGVNPTDFDKYQAGEIVGVRLPQKDILQDTINDFSKRSFGDKKQPLISQMLRKVCYVPVVDGDLTDLYVVEVDIVVSSKLLNHYTIYTQLDNLPIYHETCNEPRGVFRFSDGIPKVIPSHEIKNYKKEDLPRIVEQRLQDEKHIDTNMNLGVKLQNLLGSSINDNSFVFLLTSPDDPASTQDDIRSKVSFIRKFEPRCVFDFETRTNGVFGELDVLQEDFVQKLTLDNIKTKEDANLGKGEIAWIFCNGYDTSPRQETNVWIANRREPLQNTLNVFKRLYPVNRVIVIVCLFSEDYDTLFEACDEVFKRFKKKWILLAENEDMGRGFLDRARKRDLADTHDMQERCVIGLSWEEIDTTLLGTRTKSSNVQVTIPCSSGGSVPVAELQLKRWSDLNILTSGELISNEADVELRNKKQEVKKLFYQGDEVDWLNFYSGDNVERDIHSNLKLRVREALTHPHEFEEDYISEVKIYHQPGAGGTTAAKHILWDLRKEWRCCCLKSITEQTADQLWALREFKNTTPKPVLVFIDNQSDEVVEDLRGKLYQKIERDAKSYNTIYFTILRCVRIMDAPISGSHFSLRHKLNETDSQRFNEKFKQLESDRDISPLSLLSFNIMKNSFNENYITTVVDEFTKTVTDEMEIKLLKYLSFINSYSSNPIPVFCFDGLLQPQHEEKEAFDGPKINKVRSPHWEAKLSDAIQVLLNFRANRNIERITTIKIFNRMVAKQILVTLRKSSGKSETESEIFFEILSSLDKNYCEETGGLYEIMKTIVHHREKSSENRPERFSQFVLYLDDKEGAGKTVEVINKLYTLNEDAFTAQLLARYFVKIGEWNNALKFAKEAVDKYPNNSYIIDTLGQVYSKQIKAIAENVTSDTADIETLKRILRLSHDAQRTFIDGQKTSKDNALLKNTTENLACYFGELRTIESLLGALSKYLGETAIHEFLVYPCQKNELLSKLEGHYQRFLHSLDQRYQKLMKRLDKLCSHADDSSEPSFEQKHLVELKVNLERYFGEKAESMPAGLSEPLKCEFRMRLVRGLGATSMEAVLKLRNCNDKLVKIVELLKTNLAGKSVTAYEYKLVLQASFVLMLGNSLPETKFKDVLGWSKELYKMPGSEKNKIDLYPCFFFVIFNFPTPKREAFRLQYMSDLSTALAKWKTATIKKCSGLIDKKKKYLNRVQYFLGSASPPKDIVHVDTFKHILALSNNPERKWKNPELRNVLLPIRGMLLDGGNTVSVNIPNQKGGPIVIRTAHLVNNYSLWKTHVEFYVGFSMTGPKAYIIQYK